MLYRWRRRYREAGEQAFPGSGRQTEQEAELRRLRRELETTRQERDILHLPHVHCGHAQVWRPVPGKKALAIFSTEQK